MRGNFFDPFVQLFSVVSDKAGMLSMFFSGLMIAVAIGFAVSFVVTFSVYFCTSRRLKPPSSLRDVLKKSERPGLWTMVFGVIGVFWFVFSLFISPIPDDFFLGLGVIATIASILFTALYLLNGPESDQGRETWSI